MQKIYITIIPNKYQKIPKNVKLLKYVRVPKDKNTKIQNYIQTQKDTKLPRDKKCLINTKRYNTKRDLNFKNMIYQNTKRYKITIRYKYSKRNK